MPISNYNTGFPNGVTIRNVPIIDMQNGDGNVFWVDSETGSNENRGTFTFPFATLRYALTRVVAGQADKIYIAAGHTEDITDTETLDINKTGVQIIGLGLGNTRPIFILSGTSAVTVNVTAADCYIGNIIFTNTVVSLATILNNTGALTTIESCLFSGFLQVVDDYIKTSGNHLKLIDCEIKSQTTGSKSAVLYTGSTSNDQYINCDFYGYYTDACFNIPSGLSGSGVKDFFVDGGRYDNLADTTASFFLKDQAGNCTGQISDSTTIRVANPEKLPIYCLSTSSIGRGKAGDITAFSTIIPVAKVLGTGGYLLEIVSGSFYLEDAVIETDNSALGGATNLTMVESNDLYGLNVFYTETVANLSVTKSISLGSASIIGEKRGFAHQSKIAVARTGGILTGDNIRVSFVLRALEDGSTFVKNPSF